MTVKAIVTSSHAFLRHVFVVLVVAAGCGGSDDPGPPLTNVVAISAGGQHACAALRDGRVACWGTNFFMESGFPGNALGVLDRATIVPDVDGVTAVSAGTQSTCVLRSGGAVACWGEDDYGQLGVDPRELPLGSFGTHRPVAVPAVTNARSVVSLAPNAFAEVDVEGYCAVEGSGAAVCWGDLSPLEGAPVSFRPAAPLPGVERATALAPQRFRTGCALREDATVACWGLGTSNGLVDERGVAQNSDAPVAVVGLADVELLVGGFLRYCAAVRGGAVLCWATGDKPAAATPATGAAVPMHVVPGVTDVVSLAVAGYDYYAVTRNGRVVHWHDTNVDEGPETVRGVEDAVAVAAGHEFACALTRAGTVRCWGEGDVGQLGDGHHDGDRYRSATPTTVRLGPTPPVQDPVLPGRIDGGAADGGSEAADASEADAADAPASSP